MSIVSRRVGTFSKVRFLWRSSSISSSSRAPAGTDNWLGHSVLLRLTVIDPGYGGSAHFAAGCRQGFFVVGGNKILRVTGHHIRGQRLSMPIFVCKRRPHGFVSNGHGHSMWLGVVAWTVVSCCSRQQFNDLFHYDRQKTWLRNLRGLQVQANMSM